MQPFSWKVLRNLLNMDPNPNVDRCLYDITWAGDFMETIPYLISTLALPEHYLFYTSYEPVKNSIKFSNIFHAKIGP
jgi:hypothetical protein